MRTLLQNIWVHARGGRGRRLACKTALPLLQTTAEPFIAAEQALLFGRKPNILPFGLTAVKLKNEEFTPINIKLTVYVLLKMIFGCFV